VAESGRVVVVTNEGNSRFCLAATKCHIVLAGIEKIVPRDRDLGLLLNLLARSGTAQQLTVYTEFVAGPKSASQRDGPEEMHVVFVDNGRTEVLAGDCREILRCIRCGACLNVCPVYRQAGGHAYRSVYPGPLGAVLSPLMLGDRFSEKADLPKASSLCGACQEVCPVNIPIPDLLLRLRARAAREGISSPGVPPMGAWSLLASQPAAWRAALAAGRLLNHVPTRLLPLPALRAWERTRTLPPWRGGELRKWLRKRRAGRPQP
jgi:L-lactate dehydrogenase complex protein LldF